MKVCPKCGNEHELKGTFCSRKCANSRTFTDEVNKKRGESTRQSLLAKNPERIRRRTCQKCGNIFIQINREKICLNCPSQARNPKPKLIKEPKIVGLDLTIRLVESGELKSHVEASIRRHMRKYLIHKNGNVCSICNTTDWFGKPVPLVCDHIDGDSTNSEISNFRLVCCNCDALLDTYKSKNRGNGRKYDREYRQRKVNPTAGDGITLEK